MKQFQRRTKIVATIGPASNTPEMIRQMIHAGMDVARLNFSHGSYADHEKVIRAFRAISEELDTPITLLQDLQGPKIRVGQLPGGELELKEGAEFSLVPEAGYHGEANLIPIDYPHAASESKPGTQILMDDGLLSMKVLKIEGDALICGVVDGGLLKSRKGVNFPDLVLRLPSLTEKDKQDLDFGLEQGVDWISLSFVRTAEDIRILKKYIRDKGRLKPVIAKIEKPQAIENLEEIVGEAQGIMVARGDLGVELSPEKVPLLQKKIIELCNRKGKPVITATQMLESMIHDPRPTRAEANDVANAIIDGTDCIMLSGESAVGKYPLKAVEMMDKIAREVESSIPFKSYPPEGHSDIMALSEASNHLEKVADLKCIAVLTESGRSAMYAAAERPKTQLYAFTHSPLVYHGLNLLWGIRPLLIRKSGKKFEDLVALTETTLLERNLAEKGDKILIVGGIPPGIPGNTNFIKIHTIG
ncbi:MAG TPA: pyruvate kinase [Bacteroidales bacterium]|nr:pyruvate kinase [Bacteroidales bacterium]